MTHDMPARASTGVAGLDDVLCGGLIRGRLYLIDGSPGAGKTTVSLQYLLEGARLGERCLYVTLSETAEELRAGAESHGWNLEGIELLELGAEEDDLRGDSQLTMFNPSEVELTETTRRILEMMERVRPARMVLDSLSELRLLAQSSLRYRRQILALKQFFIGRGCTVLLLDDRTAEGPDFQLYSIAHGVVSLEHRSPAYGQAQRQLTVVKFRGSDFRSGMHDFAIRRGGLQVFPRLVASEHQTRFEPAPIRSGIDPLDALLGGGVDRGTSTLLVGPPGTGKSTVALQYALAATLRGEHAAVFTFDETHEILLARMTGIGRPVRQGNGPGEMTIRQIDPAEMSPGEFASLVRTAVEQHRASVIVVDSLNGYLNSMPEGKFLTAQLHELLSYLNHSGVATFLVVAQGGMVGPTMASPVDATYLADVVVLFRMFELQGKVKKAVSVLKKRSGPHEETIRQLSLDDGGVQLSEPLEHLRGVLTGVPVERETAAKRADGA